MKHYLPVTEINVSLDFGEQLVPVGKLASLARKIYFEYAPAFIRKGLDISPLKLPLEAGVKSFADDLFEGLPGVFNDSLPDGWGRLLADRFALSQGVPSSDITPLDRLAHVGRHGMGALVYEPGYSSCEAQADINLDSLAAQVQDVLAGMSDDVLAELIALNGSSAGARPKALIGVNDARDHIIHGVHDLPGGHTPWIVKFPGTQDGSDAGAIEYVYAIMAKDAGIQMQAVHLFPARQGAGYFATRRFDRDGRYHYHMHTASGLLHSDSRVPSLDYEDLVALTAMLTRDAREVEKMYQLAVFNVLAHNRDDHARNFSFLMDKDGQWKLSPAYDLTFSPGPGGEQSTMVMGEGKEPAIEHLVQLGEAAKVSKARIEEIIGQTRASLARWPGLAASYGVGKENIKLIARRIC